MSKIHRVMDTIFETILEIFENFGAFLLQKRKKCPFLFEESSKNSKYHNSGNFGRKTVKFLKFYCQCMIKVFLYITYRAQKLCKKKKSVIFNNSYKGYFINEILISNLFWTLLHYIYLQYYLQQVIIIRIWIFLEHPV